MAGYDVPTQPFLGALQNSLSRMSDRMMRAEQLRSYKYQTDADYAKALEAIQQQDRELAFRQRGLDETARQFDVKQKWEADQLVDVSRVDFSKYGKGTRARLNNAMASAGAADGKLSESAFIGVLQSVLGYEKGLLDYDAMMSGKRDKDAQAKSNAALLAELIRYDPGSHVDVGSTVTAGRRDVVRQEDAGFFDRVWAGLQTITNPVGAVMQSPWAPFAAQGWKTMTTGKIDVTDSVPYQSATPATGDAVFGRAMSARDINEMVARGVAGDPEHGVIGAELTPDIAMMIRQKNAQIQQGAVPRNLAAIEGLSPALQEMYSRSLRQNTSAANSGLLQYDFNQQKEGALAMDKQQQVINDLLKLVEGDPAKYEALVPYLQRGF